jgi:PAS domain S-box-containing protein
LLVAAFAALSLSTADPTLKKIFDSFHWTIAFLGATTISWMAVRFADADDQATLRWFAYALTCYTIGQVVWDVQVAVKQDPFRGPSDALFALLGPLISVGLFRDLYTRVLPTQRHSSLLDIICLTVASSAVTVTIFLGHRIENPIELFLLMGYPILLTGTAATCLVVVLSVPMRPAIGFVLMLTGLVWHATISLQWNLLSLDHKVTDGTLYDVTFSVTVLLISGGALLWNRERSETIGWNHLCSSALRMLPLLTVVAASMALVLAWNTSGISPAIRVYDGVAAAIVVVAASVRQILQLDETERRLRAEQALSASEERFRVTLDLFPVPAGITGMDSSRLAYVNAAFSELFGRSMEELIGNTALEMGLWVNPEDRSRILETLKQDRSFVAVEVSMRARDGRILPILLSCAIVEFGDEEYVAFSMTDISRRKATEEAIRISEERRKMIFDEAVDGILIATEETQFVDINATGAQMFGYSREEFLRLQLTDLVAPVHLDRLVSEYEKLRLQGGSQGEWMLVRRDGSTFWAEVKAKVLPDGMSQAIIRDLTELKQAEATTKALEAHLRHSQKMEAIGTLAAGIAHDFNNVLAAIRGNADLAIEDVIAGVPPMDSLDEIRKAGRRATDLVQRILAFSRRQEEPQELLSLGSAVEEIVKMLRATLPADVEIQMSIASDVPAIVGDPTQIHQVLVNLCTNSWQAMSGRPGRIEVRIRAVNIDGGALDLAEGEYACLEVEDTGCGIPLNVMDRIFEPFYTTKDVGQGTGLGLAVVHSIVKSHRGAIVVESTVGKGSTFRAYFPSAQTRAIIPSNIPLPRMGDSTPRSGIHVVYVDDDEALVYLVRRVLTRRGVRVTAFESSVQAMNELRVGGLRPDVLVTDLNMPAMSGFELAQEVLLAQPRLPVILTSGYVSDEMEQRAEKLGIHRVLYKPTSPDELCGEIMSLLAELEPQAIAHAET